MDSYYSLFVALVQGIVEGLTEFLPVSSTGHLIVSGSLLGFDGEKAKAFDVIIQSGAILAVCWVYRQKIADIVRGLFSEPSAQRFSVNIVIAFLPAAILGLLFAGSIKAYLFNPVTVATAFVVGGLLILWAESRKHRVTVEDVDDAAGKDALKVGLAQCLALIPGTSRSAATIAGALLLGLSRTAAAEFSFLVGLPILYGASLYKLGKHHDALAGDALLPFLVGTGVAFLSALVVVRPFVAFLRRHTFAPFAWYRIVGGALIAVALAAGWLA